MRSKHESPRLGELRFSEPILLVRLKLRKKSCVLNHFKGIQLVYSLLFYKIN